MDEGAIGEAYTRVTLAAYRKLAERGGGAVRDEAGLMLVSGPHPHALITSVMQRYRRAAPLDVAEVSACVGLEIIRGRLGTHAVPGAPAPHRLEAELDYAARLLRGGTTVELPL